MCVCVYVLCDSYGSLSLCPPPHSQINGAQFPSNLLIRRKEAGGRGEEERERHHIRNERGKEKRVRSAVKNAVVG